MRVSQSDMLGCGTDHTNQRQLIILRCNPHPTHRWSSVDLNQYLRREISQPFSGVDQAAQRPSQEAGLEMCNYTWQWLLSAGWSSTPCFPQILCNCFKYWDISQVKTRKSERACSLFMLLFVHWDWTGASPTASQSYSTTMCNYRHGTLQKHVKLENHCWVLWFVVLFVYLFFYTKTEL